MKYWEIIWITAW